MRLHYSKVLTYSEMTALCERVVFFMTAYANLLPPVTSNKIGFKVYDAKTSIDGKPATSV